MVAPLGVFQGALCDSHPKVVGNEFCVIKKLKTH